MCSNEKIRYVHIMEPPDLEENFNLCWAVEDASPDDIPNALNNWGGTGPRRALVALHHDRGHHRSSHAEGAGLAQGAACRRCFNRPYDDQSQVRIRLETEAKL